MISKVSAMLKHGLGYKTNQKILVLESDDWGSNRMPSKEIFEELKKAGIIHDHMPYGDRYDKYDTIANENDLAGLFEVLHSVKDIHGSPAKLTPVSVVANPDYEKIKANGFNTYDYELFTDYLKKRGDFDEVMKLWYEGIKGGFFVPQFHGREHLNVTKWMQALQSKHADTMYCFERGVYGAPNINGEIFLAAYDYNKPDELPLLEQITADGLNKFEEIFGFRATYFVPPNGPLSSKLNGSLHQQGIQGIQTSRLIYSEPVGGGKFSKRLRYLGRKSKYGQSYFLRNAFFEPNDNIYTDPVGKCMSDITIAFKYNKPAIVGTHRVNFIGALHEENRTVGLLQLKQLLTNISKEWPDIIFMTSGELLSLIKQKDA